jgi:hypothetical protein
MQLGRGYSVRGFSYAYPQVWRYDRGEPILSRPDIRLLDADWLRYIARIGWYAAIAYLPGPGQGVHASAYEVRGNRNSRILEQRFLDLTAQGKADKVIERMKDEAAKLGANGILLQGFGDQQTGTVGGAYGSSTASGDAAPFPGRLGARDSLLLRSVGPDAFAQTRSVSGYQSSCGVDGHCSRSARIRSWRTHPEAA